MSADHFGPFLLRAAPIVAGMVMLSVPLGALKGDITMRPIYGQKGSNALPLMPFNQLYMAFGSGQESNVDAKSLSEQAENMDRNKY